MGSAGAGAGAGCCISASGAACSALGEAVHWAAQRAARARRLPHWRQQRGRQRVGRQDGLRVRQHGRQRGGRRDGVD